VGIVNQKEVTMYDDKVATIGEISYNEEKLTDFAENGNFYRKVILEYTDGRSVTGYTNDFYPNISFFHLLKLSDGSIDKEMMIYLDELKRIFFEDNIKEDTSPYNQHLSENKGTPHDKLEIVFKDGEILTGTITYYRPNSFGFFVLTDQNNEPMRVFATSSAIREIRYVNNLIPKQVNYGN
jgi:hypothetical protein